MNKKQFLKDVKNHKMIIIKDDSLYRHIRFKRPDTKNMEFDLITWPDHLMFTGDMGSYAFTRTEDMFYFFVPKTEYLKDFEKTNINLFYWEEKVLSQSIFGNGIREFNSENFNEQIKEHFFEYEWEEKTEEEKEELWKEIEYEVTGDDEYECIERIRNFKNEKIKFDSYSFFEGYREPYTYHYIWCCHAIVWGILTYLDFKKNDNSN